MMSNGEEMGFYFEQDRIGCRLDTCYSIFLRYIGKSAADSNSQKNSYCPPSLKMLSLVLETEIEEQLLIIGFVCSSTLDDWFDYYITYQEMEELVVDAKYLYPIVL